MVQKRIVELLDDLDGGQADETVSFGIDGRGYEIDLSSANGSALRGALSPYLAAGRRSSGVPPFRKGRLRHADSGAGETAAIRQWAIENGYPVNRRGRIPAEIREAYETR